MMLFERNFPVEGIEISRAYAGGRTVEAYAAVFDDETEITDQHGHYIESIDRSAFNRTIKAARATCIYNHGMNLDGSPSGLGQVPLGKPLEIRADARGLFTVTRYNNSALADAVLESIRNGDITAQSFRGRILRSNPNTVPRVRPGQPLPKVVRLELGLADYGPTPTAYYANASITAVRSQVLAEMLRALSSTTPEEDPETTTATPTTGPGAEDPPDTVEHSGRLLVARARAQIALVELSRTGETGAAA